MVYCVVPRELESELFAKLAEYYEGNPNVTVILDRRSGPDRRTARVGGGLRVTRDRRRSRVPGSFLATDPPGTV